MENSSPSYTALPFKEQLVNGLSQALVNGNADPVLQMIRALPVAIYTCDKNGYVQLYNSAAVELWGREPQPGIDLWCGSFKIFNKDGSEITLDECPMAITLREGKAVEGEEVIIERPDGRRINALPHPIPLFDDAGNLKGAVNMVVDITKKKAADEKLATLAAIVQSSDDAIIGKTLEGIITSWNDAATRIFGYSSEEMIGQPVTLLIPPDRLNEEPGILERLKRGEKVEHFNTVRITRDKRLIDISLTISPIRDEKGHIIGASKIARDITKQKKTESDIKDSELLFKTISSASPAALWMTDANGQNVFVNETWINWTGKPFDHQLTDGWLGSVVQEDRNRVIEKFTESIQNLKQFRSEFRFLRNDGELRWGLSEGYPYNDSSGSFSGYAGSVTDITDLKKLEQRKDDFIKMASHELKTPITSIKGYVQLLLNIYDELNEEKLQAARPTVKSALHTISKQVSKLTRLISELLDLSKIESAKLELNKSEFDLASLVEETVQDLRQTTLRHAILINNSFEGHVYADRDRIAQVLVNLLTNAIKYSPAAESVEVKVSRGAQAAIIRVKDSGIGIDKKDHQKIFERFYRVEGKSEQTYPGFGIGLFIASEIIQRHNGTITVESEKGKGSEFIVTLPLNLR